MEEVRTSCVCVCVSTLCRDSWAVRKVDGFTVCVCVSTRVSVNTVRRAVGVKCVCVFV